jgi:hypothetical protein
MAMDESQEGSERPEDHPRGTLLIVGLFGLLFFVGWLLAYFLLFAGRGEIY